MVIALLNESSVAQRDVDCIVKACNLQLERDFEPAYGLEHHPVEFFASRDEVPPGSSVVVLFPDEVQATTKFGLPKDPNPLIPEAVYGVGVVDDHGRSFARVFVNRVLGNDEGTALDGLRSVSVSTSHEVLECRADPYINQWAVGPDLRAYAYEVCDAVDDQYYEVEVKVDENGPPERVCVADFVLLEWWNPKAINGPFNHNHERKDERLPGPFKYSRRGFATVFDPRARTGGTRVEPPDAYPEWKAESRNLEIPFARSRWHLIHGAS
jgi:hypothetical protein